MHQKFSFLLYMYFQAAQR